MRGRQPDFPGLFLGSNPDRAGSADQGERIVSDDFRRALQLKLDGVVGKWPDGVKFIGHAQHDAGGVGSVRNQAGVVGQQCEFLVDALAGDGS